MCEGRGTKKKGGSKQSKRCRNMEHAALMVLLSALLTSCYHLDYHGWHWKIPRDTSSTLDGVWCSRGRHLLHR